MTFIIGSDRKATVLRPSGWMLHSGPEGQIEQDTVQCVHCGNHDPIIPGSGRKRGFCTHCNGPTCTKRSCHVHCYPFEKKLDDYEKGKLKELF